MIEKLLKIFASYNIGLTQEQAKLFEKYFKLLISWNEKFNLTAITDEDEVIVKHFLDSVLLAEFIPKNASVVDVGSGAGFPGIPLKILRDDINLVMIDSLQKRVGFLEEMIKELNLNNSSAIHTRGEDFASPNQNREKFDVCVSRAVARLATLSEVCLPLVKVGGLFVPSKSAECKEEVEEAKKAISILGGEFQKTIEIHIVENGSQRSFPIIKKIKPTQAKYPRGKNLPKTNPLI
ncbi:MAG: 16S rRNA (guanine(527)-N(7))-methyltransferase RsmG [Clostridia bacterium]